MEKVINTGLRREEIKEIRYIGQGMRGGVKRDRKQRVFRSRSDSMHNDSHRRCIIVTPCLRSVLVLDVLHLLPYPGLVRIHHPGWRLLLLLEE
ncbi:hypothetical protein PHLCEN_2v3783 [Hermanssonia centrifuga]|uniref:Uncharacterized protein n=1 Tax=Hermanssonia centrifuga TaxID=98765 RepID=A0A2R6QBI6_9APHY|nr:hypothetical protein PHLCEN_2v3783 [Hermanssonia centrifuga]